MNFKQVSLLLIVLLLMAFGLPKNIQKKVDKEIKSVFSVETFSFNVKEIPLEISKSIAFKIWR